MHIAMIGQKSFERSDKTGGIEVHVHEISQRLVKMGHRVTAYVRPCYSQACPADMDGIQLVYHRSLRFKHLEAITHTLFATLHVIRQDVDVIHYHGVGPATLSWIPRLFKRKATVITTFHSQDRFHAKWGWFARMYLLFGEWAAVHFAQYCIAVSHTIQIYCRDILHRETVYIPNGAEVCNDTNRQYIEELGLQPDQYLLNVGRIVPHKSLHVLIQAFMELETDKQLILVGGATFTHSYETELKELAARDERIRFIGFQDRDVVDALYAHAYLYVHPSQAEGLPLVLLEAMSHGLPPVVANIPANLEPLHGIGYTFAAGDVEALRETLTQAIRLPEEVAQMHDDARAIITHYYDWDMIANQTEEVYLTARH